MKWWQSPSGTVWCCDRHFELARQVAVLMAFLVPLDKVVILRVPSPPRYEGGGGAWTQEVLPGWCEFCEWETDSSVFTTDPAR